MLYKYGQIECAGWFAGKQNVLHILRFLVSGVDVIYRFY